MHNLSGIKPSISLLSNIANLRTGPYRLIMIKIENESYELDKVIKGHYSWQEDYKWMMPRYLSEDIARYIFFRMDDDKSLLFITWIPDKVKVRERMIYASSKTDIRNIFGSSSIVDQFLLNSKDQIPSIDQLMKKYDLKHELKTPVVSLDSRSSRLSAAELLGSAYMNRSPGGSMQFHLDDRLINALRMFKSSSTNAITMSIDANTECVILKWTSASGHQGLAEICKQIHVSEHEGQYHLVRLLEYKKIVFIYSVPAVASAHVKDRMLCSSALNSTLEQIKKLGIDVNQKIEVSSKDELVNTLMDLWKERPESLSPLTKFNRPMARGRTRNSDV
ncbi:hypothetical protein ACOME3_007784 [Neoechinorhynchus agilis]